MFILPCLLNWFSKNITDTQGIRDLDSVIIFKSRQERWLDKEFWGKEDDMTSFLL